MKKTIILFGKMAAGKSTTAKLLEEAGYKRIITDTTRAMRPGETDGVDYRFLSEEEFLSNMSDDIYAETANYTMADGKKVYYGSRKNDYSEGAVIVLNPTGLRSVRKAGIPCVAFYLNASAETIQKRTAIRGDNPAEIERRIKEDEPYFVDAKKLCDFEICIDDKTEREVLSEVLMRLSTISGNKIPKTKMKHSTRRKNEFKKEQKMREESAYRGYASPMIIEKDGVEKRFFKHSSEAERFLKKQSNKKERKRGKEEARKCEFAAYEDEAGVKRHCRDNSNRRGIDIAWTLF